MKSKDKYIVIVGCSYFGSSIANSLSEQGSDVLVIDTKAEALDKLSTNFSGFKLQGDATDIDVLEEANLKDADLLVLATHSDNKNIMIAQIAKEIFNVKKIVSRLYNLDKDIIYKGLDIEIIRPAELAMNEFKKVLKNNGSELE